MAVEWHMTCDHGDCGRELVVVARHDQQAIAWLLEKARANDWQVGFARHRCAEHRTSP